MKRVFCLFVSLILLSPLVTPVFSQMGIVDDRLIADYVFVNSNIITVDDDHPSFEAIAVSQGDIVALGSTADILGNYTTETNTTYDLQGLTMMPGIIDGHTHYLGSRFWNNSIDPIYDAQELALNYGFTTLTEKSMSTGDVEYLQNAEQNGDLRLRINCFPIYNLASIDTNGSAIIVEDWYTDHLPILDHDLKVRVPGIKIYADGATGGHKGFPAMSVPYTQDMINMWGITNPYGDLYINQTELNVAVDTIHDAGFSCAFHAMGDRAIETVLNAIEYALNGSLNDDYRHQVEHNSFMRADLITRAKTLRTIHSLRGYFPTYYQQDYADLYPDDWEEWNVNRYSFPDEGVHTYLETDNSNWVNLTDKSRSTHLNPFLHLWGMVTRKAVDKNGTVHAPDPWVAEHTISVEQALKVLTIEGAYAVKQEDYIGTLEVGKYADLIIITGNPLLAHPDELRFIETMLTMVDGKIEYQMPTYTFQTMSVTPTTRLVAPWTTLMTLTGLVIVGIISRKKAKKQ